MLSSAGFSQLLAALRADGYALIGPTIRDGTIALDEIESSDELPIGVTLDCAPGKARLRKRNDTAAFGYAVGQDSFKRFLKPPRRLLWRAHRTNDGVAFEETQQTAPKLAFIGVRPCDFHGIRRLDRVLIEGAFIDEDYKARREASLIVVVNCGAPASTCFCTSMDTGPELAEKNGADLVLTEIMEDKSPRYLLEAPSARGRQVAESMQVKEADKESIDGANHTVAAAAASISRRMETNNLPTFLAENDDHPNWDDVGARCLSCANCTSVCPTCFCSTTEDLTSLDGNEAERVDRWDSCFTALFSELGGGPVRETTSSRYRQWMTHKLSSWHEQFGSSGCVGCGRCIAWCPVGIDITAEVARMRESSP